MSEGVDFIEELMDDSHEEEKIERRWDENPKYPDFAEWADITLGIRSKTLSDRERNVNYDNAWMTFDVDYYPERVVRNVTIILPGDGPHPINPPPPCKGSVSLKLIRPDMIVQGDTSNYMIIRSKNPAAEMIVHAAGNILHSLKVCGAVKAWSTTRELNTAWWASENEMCMAAIKASLNRINDYCKK